MCRNIKTLFNFEPPATEEEIQASALQFVRKLSGFTRPSKANEAAFELAVEQVRDAAGIFIMPDTPVVLIDETELRSNIKYPISAINGGVSGRVILRYVVDEQGQIGEINVVKGLGWGTEDVVIDLLRRAKYQPATFNGEPVQAWATFTTVFRLNNQ